MSDNVFQILGIQSREDCISNAIAYAFNHCQWFRDDFLTKICDKQPTDYQGFLARTRVSVAGHGTPDIVLVCSGPVAIDLIVIENKLRAEEGDQTERYSSEAFCTALSRRLCPDYPSIGWTFVFLTLFPDQEPRSSKFAHKSHRALAHTALGHSPPQSLAEMLIHDWGVLLHRFYEKEAVDPHDDVLKKLQDEDGLDSGYLYFREALLQLNLPGSLQVDDFFRSSQQGRRYYGGIISKDQWRLEEMVQLDGERWNLAPAKNFHIHFEPQYDVINYVLKLYLHYEVYPYQPESWVRQHVAITQYEEYIARRTAFFDHLHGKVPRGWSFALGYNMIARADLDFRGKTFGDVKRLMESMLTEMSSAIDESLEALGR